MTIIYLLIFAISIKLIFIRLGFKPLKSFINFAKHATMQENLGIGVKNNYLKNINTSILEMSRGGVTSCISTQIKGILAILIITHHVSFRYLNHPIIGQFNCFGTIVVAIFFFLSGYGLTKSLSNKGIGYIDNFLPQRLQKLLPSFMLATILWILYELSSNKDLDWFATRMINGNPPLPTSWFVLAIIYFYFAFYISCKFGKSILWQNMLMAFMTLSYCFIIRGIFHWGGWWINAAFAFNVGMLISSYECNILIRLIKIRDAYIIAILSLALISMVTLYLSLSFVYNLTICVLVWLILAISDNFNYSIFHFLGKYSYEIYLVQGAIIAVMGRLGLVDYLSGVKFLLVSYLISILTAMFLKYLTLSISSVRFVKSQISN
ncbi:MAG: acyltransferase family protein [Muribaculum sp.]|nr:acyltransferase family protein [Muribaculum sp.]